MNSSVKFILNQLEKLKLPLIGYTIILSLLIFGVVISESTYGSAQAFRFLLSFVAPILPLFILTFAVIQFFSFRSDKSYHIFLTSIPITHKKQIHLSLVSLLILVVLFTLVSFGATSFVRIPNFEAGTYNPIPFNEILNMSVVYFATTLLFTAILFFLKLLLVHNRSFYIALFFFVLSVGVVAIVPSKVFNHTTLLQTILPLPFNLLPYSISSYPHLSIYRLSFLFLSTGLFTAMTLYLYHKERISHAFDKTQQRATIIIYTLILTQLLYVIYTSSPLDIIIILFITLILIAILILKISLKKIHIKTLLTTFLIANCLSVPFAVTTPYIIEQQSLAEWERTQFTTRQYINLDLSDVHIFNKNRTISFYFSQNNTLVKNNILKELHKFSTLKKFANDNVAHTSILYSSSDGSFSIQWNSPEEKREFSKSIEKTLTELDATHTLKTTAYASTFDSSEYCSISIVTPPCNNQISEVIPTIKEAITAVDKQTNLPSYTINIQSDASSSPFIFITHA